MSDTLEVLGCVAATGSASAALLVADRRWRAAALIGAMLLALALVAGQGWDELDSIRDRPAAFGALLAGGVLGLALLTAALLRWPILLPLLLVAALPFRIPIGVGGGDDVNLLVPLYAVLGAGVLAYAIAAWREARAPTRRRGAASPVPSPLALALAAALVLYGLQASYSNDVDFATRNVGFFLVPFAAMFCLLAELRWTPRLLALSFVVVLGEALLFALVGIGQHIAGDIFWNQKLDMSNDFHFYFRVNSLFWDPNIFGRYLALAIVIAAAVLMWIEDRCRAIWLVLAIAIAFAGLLTTLSQTSFIALLTGLGVLCALRWSARWTAIAAPVVAAVALAGILFVGDTSDQSARDVTEGRSTLFKGGLELAKERPLQGHGSASFSRAFAEEESVKPGENTVSHNEPVAVAAEQGAIGIVSYLALAALSLWTLFAGMRGIAPGLGARFRPIGGRATRAAPLAAARVAVAAAFCALLVHTVGYASYLTDPLTWALLAIGVALVVQTGVTPAVPRVPGIHRASR